MKRRILCVLLALVLCVALLPVTAGAANENVKWLDISAGEINIDPDGYTGGKCWKDRIHREIRPFPDKRRSAYGLVLGRTVPMT